MPPGGVDSWRKLILYRISSRFRIWPQIWPRRSEVRAQAKYFFPIFLHKVVQSLPPSKTLCFLRHKRRLNRPDDFWFTCFLCSLSRIIHSFFAKKWKIVIACLNLHTFTIRFDTWKICNVIVFSLSAVNWVSSKMRAGVRFMFSEHQQNNNCRKIHNVKYRISSAG